MIVIISVKWIFNPPLTRTMKDEKDIVNYISALLNTNEVKPETVKEIQNIQLLLFVYTLGLERKNLDARFLLKHFTLDDTPPEYHTIVAQMAIIKSQSGDGRTMQYLT